MAHELKGREETMLGPEERCHEHGPSRGISRLGRARQALFALVDNLAKILLTCIPEPDAGAMDAAVARAERASRPIDEGRRPGNGRRLAVGVAGPGKTVVNDEPLSES